MDDFDDDHELPIHQHPNPPNQALVHVLDATQARVNVTYSGNNGDLPDPIAFDATDADIKRWVGEALATGGIPGIPAVQADLRDFVVDRFGPNETRPHNQIQIRPKVPFGFACQHCTTCEFKANGAACCECGQRPRG